MMMREVVTSLHSPFVPNKSEKRMHLDMCRTKENILSQAHWLHIIRSERNSKMYPRIYQKSGFTKNESDI